MNGAPTTRAPRTLRRRFPQTRMCKTLLQFAMRVIKDMVGVKSQLPLRLIDILKALPRRAELARCAARYAHRPGESVSIRPSRWPAPSWRCPNTSGSGSPAAG